MYDEVIHIMELCTINKKMNDKKQPWFNKATVQAALVNTIPAFLVAVVGIYFTWNNSHNQIVQNELFFKKQMQRDSILNIKQTQLNLNQLELNKQELALVKKQTFLDSINLSFSKNQNDFLNNQIVSTNSNNWFDFVHLVSMIGEHLDNYYKTDSMDFISTNFNTNDFYLKKMNKTRDCSVTLIKIMQSGLRNPQIINDKKIWDLWKSILNSSKSIISTIDYDIKFFENADYKETTNFNEKILKQIYHEYFLLQVLIQERRTNDLLN